MPAINIISNEDFFSYAQKIKNNKLLNSSQKLILFTIYSYKNKKLTQKLPDMLIADTSLPASEIKKSLYCLVKRGWLIIKNKSCRLQYSETTEKGKKIAHSWSNIFGSLQLTPYSFKKIITFIDDGIEEELIIEILKASSDNARGNPLNYCYAILSNFLEKNIYRLEDYYDYRKERGKNLEKQISTGTKKNKKEMERETLSELYKKGYQ